MANSILELKVWSLNRVAVRSSDQAIKDAAANAQSLLSKIKDPATSAADKVAAEK